MEIITVKMSEDSTGSPDGCYVKSYVKGGTYNLPAELANAFIDMEVAKKEKVGARSITKTEVSKTVSGAQAAITITENTEE